ncbi:unnamed protein product, partial [Ectocarpus sp. 8 AP-2014]
LPGGEVVLACCRVFHSRDTRLVITSQVQIYLNVSRFSAVVASRPRFQLLSARFHRHAHAVLAFLGRINKVFLVVGLVRPLARAVYRFERQTRHLHGRGSDMKESPVCCPLP